MKDMKAALSKSLEAEDDAVRSRFEKAESLLGPKRNKAKRPKNEGNQPKKPKSPKPKVIRDSFSLPENDYGLIKDLQKRCLRLAQSVSKSELVRAGLHILAKIAGCRADKDYEYLGEGENGKTIKSIKFNE